MSGYIVKKSSLNGEIQIPSSKSHTLRAILFGSLAHGKSIIHNYLDSKDTESMIKACQLFGAEIDVFPNRIEIEGLKGKIAHARDVIDAGNSGIVLRFCSALGAICHHPIVITGDHSIRYQRPMEPLLSGLCQLGMKAISMRGDLFAPVIIQGPMQAGIAEIDGQDSQAVSALLIGGAFANGEIELIVNNPGEKPWIDLTLSWFKRLGIHYENTNFEKYRVFGNSAIDGFEYTVPGDFSSAAFPLAAALITDSTLTIKNLDMADAQGDKEFITVLQKMGALIDIDEKNKAIHVQKASHLQGLSIDINPFIDALPMLAALSCYAKGQTHIYNARAAKHKESNRLATIALELKKMGGDIKETEDGLIIQNSPLNGASVFSHHDHRIAMALTVGGLGAIGDTSISSISCVAKTFPTFCKDFNSIGANLQEI